MSAGALREPGAEDHFSVDAVRDHYDRVSPFYHALWGEHVHHGYWEDGETDSSPPQVRLVERLASLAGIRPGARVLDVGCGLGGSALWLARRLGCSVLGLNISPVQVSIAEGKARDEGLGGQVEFRVADARHLDLPSESFDAVWVVECSEHLPDKARFVSDCARVLKTGGALALCAWLKAEPPGPAGGERLVAEVCRGMLCPHLASMSDYTRWMRDAGLRTLAADDVTRNVKETWARCVAIARRGEVESLVGAADEGTRRFVESFALMGQAFDSGAMAYGMFAAVKV